MSRLVSILLLAVLVGVVLGYSAAQFDSLYLGVFTAFAWLWLMILGIPREKSGTFRQGLTYFCMLALSMAWIVYFLIRKAFT